MTGSDGEDDSSSAPSHAAAGPTISFGFNLGKIRDQGEDSDPILRTGRDLGLAAVFDGMGGAGGTAYETPDGPRSGAYLASRLARDVVEQKMLDFLEPEWHLDGPATAGELHDAVKDALVARLQELNAPATKLRSKLLRALPTTMAMVALQRHEPTGLEWSAHVLWAGDSRAYVFDPAGGARQLTTDDLRDAGDAMVNLRLDSVVGNAMSADTEFTVHYRHVELEAPFLLVAATDGCLGYVKSPMHFEQLVLSELRDADDVDAWSAAIQRRVVVITGDDAAMATLGVGADFDELRSLFAERVVDLEERFTAPLDDLDQQVIVKEQELLTIRSRRDEQRQALWSAYKPDYERYLVEPDDDHADDDRAGDDEETG
ncbi:MAG: PP2C family protein-serine/threonine phosphatase [Ilumatobacteraceae bacterium]